MDRLARRVAARWGRLALTGERDEYFVTPQRTTDPEIFQDARASVEALFPHFTALLQSKLHEHYHATVSQKGTNVYYFFQAHNPIDAFSVNLFVKHGELYMVVGYVPFNPASDSLDYSKAIQQHGFFDNPEVAGTQLMRLTRMLLERAL